MNKVNIPAVDFVLTRLGYGTMRDHKQAVLLLHKARNMINGSYEVHMKDLGNVYNLLDYARALFPLLHHSKFAMIHVVCCACCAMADTLVGVDADEVFLIGIQLKTYASNINTKTHPDSSTCLVLATEILHRAIEVWSLKHNELASHDSLATMPVVWGRRDP